LKSRRAGVPPGVHRRGRRPVRVNCRSSRKGSYGTFKEYIKRQKEHHRSGELVPELEETFEEIKDE